MPLDEFGNWYDDEGFPLLPPDLQELYESGGLNREKAEVLAKIYRGSSPTQGSMSERVTDVTYVPPKPVGIPYVPRESPAGGASFKFGREEYNTPLIAGYGRRLALIRPETGRAGATNDYGVPVSEGDLKDMEDTMAAFYRGDISEEQLKVKGGMPARPTNQQLDEWDKQQEIIKAKTPEIEAEGQTAYDDWMKNHIIERGLNYDNARLGAIKAKELAIKEGMKILKDFAKDYVTRQATLKKTAPTKVELYDRAVRGDKAADAALKRMAQDEQDQAAAAREGKGDITNRDIYLPAIKALPKERTLAEAADRRVVQYEKLSKMADEGAGGLVPGLKGILSPVLEALGMDTKIESEAQAYQLMARAGVGSMRLMLVGSGQVSNYEQDLMQRLSGGSIKTSREAAKLLFAYYAAESRHTVANYNKRVEDISKEFPEVIKAHGYIGKRSGVEGTGGGQTGGTQQRNPGETVAQYLKRTKR